MKAEYYFDAKYQAEIVKQILGTVEARELLTALLSEWTTEEKAAVKEHLTKVQIAQVRSYLTQREGYPPRVLPTPPPATPPVPLGVVDENGLTEFGRQTAARWTGIAKNAVRDIIIPTRKPYQHPIIPNAEETKQRLLTNWDDGDKLLNMWVMEFTATERALVIPLLAPQQKEYIDELESNI